jgi:hypothetical protein
LIPIIVAVLLFASAWISNYDPFISGSRGYASQDPRIRTSDVSVFGVDGRVFTIPMSDPTRFRYTFSVVNDGPIAVTITGVGSPVDEPPAALTTKPVRIVPDERTPGPNGALVYEPWHPFVPKPGQEAGIEMLLAYRPSSCFGGGATMSVWPETIRFTVLGIPRETTFESDLELRIVATEDCPDS